MKELEEEQRFGYRGCQQPTFLPRTPRAKTAEKVRKRVKNAWTDGFIAGAMTISTIALILLLLFFFAV